MGLSVIYPFFSYVVYEMCEFLIFGEPSLLLPGGKGVRRILFVSQYNLLDSPYPPSPLRFRSYLMIPP